MQDRLVAFVLFGMAGLLSAIVAWLAIGHDTHPIVMRAVVCPVIAGGLIGLLCVPGLLRGRRLLCGALGGVLVHPMAWSIFVTWAWLSAWTGGREPAGHILDGLSNALVWSVASLAYGFLLTIPTFVGAAWLWPRLRPTQLSDRSE